MNTKAEKHTAIPCHCDRPDCYEPRYTDEITESLLEACKKAMSIIRARQESLKGLTLSMEQAHYPYEIEQAINHAEGR